MRTLFLPSAFRLKVIAGIIFLLTACGPLSNNPDRFESRASNQTGFSIGDQPYVTNDPRLQESTDSQLASENDRLGINQTASGNIAFAEAVTEVTVLRLNSLGRADLLGTSRVFLKATVEGRDLTFRPKMKTGSEPGRYQLEPIHAKESSNYKLVGEIIDVFGGEKSFASFWIIKYENNRAVANARIDLKAYIGTLQVSTTPDSDLREQDTTAQAIREIESSLAWVINLHVVLGRSFYHYDILRVPETASSESEIAELLFAFTGDAIDASTYETLETRPRSQEFLGITEPQTAQAAPARVSNPKNWGEMNNGRVVSMQFARDDGSNEEAMVVVPEYKPLSEEQFERYIRRNDRIMGSFATNTESLESSGEGDTGVTRGSTQDTPKPQNSRQAPRLEYRPSGSQTDEPVLADQKTSKPPANSGSGPQLSLRPTLRPAPTIDPVSLQTSESTSTSAVQDPGATSLRPPKSIPVRRDNVIQGTRSPSDVLAQVVRDRKQHPVALPRFGARPENFTEVRYSMNSSSFFLGNFLPGSDAHKMLLDLEYNYTGSDDNRRLTQGMINKMLSASKFKNRYINFWKSANPIRDLIVKIAKAIDIAPSLMTRAIAESDYFAAEGYNLPRIKPGAAVGIGQFFPDAAFDVGLRQYDHRTSGGWDHRRHVIPSLCGILEYKKWLYEQYPHDATLVYLSYHLGAGSPRSSSTSLHPAKGNGMMAVANRAFGFNVAKKFRWTYLDLLRSGKVPDRTGQKERTAMEKSIAGHFLVQSPSSFGFPVPPENEWLQASDFLAQNTQDDLFPAGGINGIKNTTCREVVSEYWHDLMGLTRP